MQASTREPQGVLASTQWSTQTLLIPQRAGFPHAFAANGACGSEGECGLTVLPPVNSDQQPAADHSGSKDVGMSATVSGSNGHARLPGQIKDALYLLQPQRVRNNAHASHSALPCRRFSSLASPALIESGPGPERSRNPQVHRSSSSRSRTDTYHYYLRTCMHKPFTTN